MKASRRGKKVVKCKSGSAGREKVFENRQKVTARPKGSQEAKCKRWKEVAKVE